MFGICMVYKSFCFRLHKHEHTRRDRQESTLILIETVVVAVAGGVMEVEAVQFVGFLVFFFFIDGRTD